MHTYATKTFFGPQNPKTFLSLYQRSYCNVIYYCVKKSVNRLSRGWIYRTHVRIKRVQPKYARLHTKGQGGSNFGNFCAYALCGWALIIAILKITRRNKNRKVRWLTYHITKMWKRILVNCWSTLGRSNSSRTTNPIKCST